MNVFIYVYVLAAIHVYRCVGAGGKQEMHYVYTIIMNSVTLMLNSACNILLTRILNSD